MVDLDSNPTKLIEVVEIGKQMLMTRGALTTFSVANDVAKYFAIIPAMLHRRVPADRALNVMDLGTPVERHPERRHLQCAHHHLSRPARAARSEVPAVSAGDSCSATCSSMGLGGLVVPFVGIKVIDLVVPTCWEWCRHARDHSRNCLVIPAADLLVCSSCAALSTRSRSTGIGQALFPRQANGSLVDRQGNPATPDTAVGSSLLGQGFKSARVFSPTPLGGGLRLRRRELERHQPGPFSDKLLNGVADDPKTKDVDESFTGSTARRCLSGGERSAGRCARPRRRCHPVGEWARPAHHPAECRLSGARVAKARGVNVDEVRALLDRQTKGRQWGLFGDPRVNVLETNLALDRELPETHPDARREGRGCSVHRALTGQAPPVVRLTPPVR